MPLSAENFTKLQEAYANGTKLVVDVCKECNWHRGFYFLKGTVRYDPGCFCDGRTGTEYSSRELLERYLEKHPNQFSVWMAAAYRERVEIMKLREKQAKYKMEMAPKKVVEVKEKKTSPQMPLLF